MKKKSLFILPLLGIGTLLSFTLCNTPTETGAVEEPIEKDITVKPEPEPHNYGGWYCPDNLTGFPAVDIKEWNKVPVVNGRLATQEEAQSGAALIFVDIEMYPDAKPLDMEMPQLARYYNRSSGKNELIIVIQALNISNDAIVGFRFLNGGNGSARLNEVNVLSDSEIEEIVPSKFVSFSIEIESTKAKTWDVVTKQAYFKKLKPIFDKENKLKADWKETSKVNYNYPGSGGITSEFAGNLYGNQYIQIDAELGDYQYVEKFLISENEETKRSTLQIVCGPFVDDFKEQKAVLNTWAQKVKELAE